MKRNFIMLAMLLSIAFSGWAIGNSDPSKTSAGWCSSGIPDEKWETEFQQRIAQFTATHDLNSRTSQTTITIPVIVHIIYWSNTSAQNLSKAQVDSQINILNRNYAGASQYVGNVPTAFKPVIANTGIAFCAAKINQNGTVLAEPGIDRVNAQTKGFANPGNGVVIPFQWDKTYVETTVKPATIWDPRYYCNIWIIPGFKSDANGQIIAYSTFPTMTTLDGLFGGTGTMTSDGVVCSAFAYGKGGSTISPYNQGGTASHELGHFLGLRHIWGDANCATDYCNDTPTQQKNNTGCPSYPHVTCSNGPNGDMFMNYMDYSDDNCTSMFTNDQKARMQTAMATGNLRVPLLSSTVCDTAKPAPVAVFNFVQSPLNPCLANGTFSFTDKSLFSPTSWSWTFAGGTPATSPNQNPSGVTFATAGLHDVTLTVTSPKGSNSITQQVNVVITGSTTLPLSEGFEGATFPPVGWSFKKRNPDPAVNWDVRDGSSGFGVGNRSMIFDNTSLDAQYYHDDILTPKVDLTGAASATLKFDVAYAPYWDSATSTQLFDTLEVYLTDNCENTVQRIYNKGGTTLATELPGEGPEFYPAANQWRTETVSIPAAYLNKPNVQVLFRNFGDYGHTIYIDNINLSTPTSTAVASFTTSDTVVCKGSTLTFTNTSSGSPDSVRWTINGGTPSTSTSTSAVTSTFNTVGNYSIVLTVYKGGAASTPFSTSIRVKALPATNAGTDQTICSGTSATLTATGATAYQWTGGPATAGYTVSPGSTTDYIVTGTTSGCSSKDTVRVNVNPAPTTNAGSDQTICSGSSATLTATGATSYQWTGGPATAGYTVSPGSTTDYVVTGTIGSCSKKDTVRVNVNPLPSTNAGSDQTICAGTSATLTATGATTYQWTGGPATAGYTVSPTTGTDYIVTGTTNSCSKKDTVHVNVNPSPATNAGSDQSVCAGSSVTLTATGATTYQWTGGPATAGYTFTPGSSTDYIVTGTSSGCSSKDTVHVTVKPLPTTNAGSDQTICTGNSVTLTATGATTYQWTGGPATAGYTVSPTSTTTYTVTGTTNGCSKSDDVTIIVTTTNPTVTITTNTGVTSICNGQSIILTGNGAGTYQWAGGPSTAGYTVSPTSNTNYTVTGTVTGCPALQDTETVQIIVKSLPPTDAGPDQTICSGQGVTLTATGASTYQWTGGPATASYTVSPSSNTTYTVTGTTNGCSAADNVTVSVNTAPAPGTITQRNDTIFSSGSGTSYNWYRNSVFLVSTSTPYLKITQSGSYQVEVVGANTCVSTKSASFSATVTGIRTNTLNIQYNIIPNPNNGEFEVRIVANKTAKYQLVLYSVTGQEIMREDISIVNGINSKRYNFSKLQSGVYFLSLVGSEGMTTQTLTIQ